LGSRPKAATTFITSAVSIAATATLPKSDLRRSEGGCPHSEYLRSGDRDHRSSQRLAPCTVTQAGKSLLISGYPDTASVVISNSACLNKAHSFPRARLTPASRHPIDRRANALVIDGSGRHQLTLEVARAPYVRDRARVVLEQHFFEIRRCD
jgi:hypothetical protein